jgi:hypothetical protein
MAERFLLRRVGLHRGGAFPRNRELRFRPGNALQGPRGTVRATTRRAAIPPLAPQRTTASATRIRRRPRAEQNHVLERKLARSSFGAGGRRQGSDFSSSTANPLRRGDRQDRVPGPPGSPPRPRSRSPFGRPSAKSVIAWLSPGLAATRRRGTARFRHPPASAPPGRSPAAKRPRITARIGKFPRISARGMRRIAHVPGGHQRRSHRQDACSCPCPRPSRSMREGAPDVGLETHAAQQRRARVTVLPRSREATPKTASERPSHGSRAGGGRSARLLQRMADGVPQVQYLPDRGFRSSSSTTETLNATHARQAIAVVTERSATASPAPQAFPQSSASRVPLFTISARPPRGSVVSVTRRSRQ